MHRTMVVRSLIIAAMSLTPQYLTNGDVSGLLIQPCLRNVIATTSDKERTLWSGKSDGLIIEWSDRDLYVRRSESEKAVAVFGPLVENGIEAFRKLMFSERSVSRTCDYVRSFRLLGVVGQIITFEDSYYDYCGGAHPSAEVRFTSVDLSKSGTVAYAWTGDPPLMNVDMTKRGRIAALSDYYEKKDIVEALWKEPDVKRILGERNRVSTL